jgi:hypothetical protein
MDRSVGYMDGLWMRYRPIYVRYAHEASLGPLEAVDHKYCAH